MTTSSLRGVAPSHALVIIVVGSTTETNGMTTKLYSFADAARIHGCKARDISDLIYARHLDETQLVQVGNRRVIPESFMPTVQAVLSAHGKIRPEFAAPKPSNAMEAAE